MDTHGAPAHPAALDPQVAYNDWLREAVAALGRWMSRDAGRDEWLARAVDPADLERRLRTQERGMPSPRFR